VAHAQQLMTLISTTCFCPDDRLIRRLGKSHDAGIGMETAWLCHGNAWYWHGFVMETHGIGMETAWFFGKETAW